MNKDKIKQMFIDSSMQRIESINKNFEEIKRKNQVEVDDLILDTYILAHSINSSSVFLPILKISQSCKLIENDIKKWLEDGYVLSEQKIEETEAAIDKLRIMINNIEDYLGESNR